MGLQEATVSEPKQVDTISYPLADVSQEPTNEKLDSIIKKLIELFTF